VNEATRDQAVTYLLGELKASELAEFERRLAADPDLRGEVERLAPVVRELGELPREVWEAEEPPPLELPGSGPPARGSAPASWRGWFTMRRLAWGAAAATAIFAGGIVLGTELGDNPQPSPITASLELAPLAGAGGQGAGTVTLTQSDPGTAEVVVQGLPESAPGTYYELWLLGEDEIVSLGSFTVGPDGTADTVVSIPFDPGEYDSFDISVEQEDGDPSHSGDSVLRGPTSTT
jgi:anti-sigma-K factor RskA